MAVAGRSWLWWWWCVRLTVLQCSVIITFITTCVLSLLLLLPGSHCPTPSTHFRHLDWDISRLMSNEIKILSRGFIVNYLLGRISLPNSFLSQYWFVFSLSLKFCLKILLSTFPSDNDFEKVFKWNHQFNSIKKLLILLHKHQKIIYKYHEVGLLFCLLVCCIMYTG